MRTRIHEIPACFTETIEIDAERYHLIQRALNRLGKPLRFPLVGLCHLDMILEADSWVCIDRGALELPVVAWHQFKKTSRQNLQSSVWCELRHYRVNTDILLPYVWMTIESTLKARLSEGDSAQTAPVISLFPD